LPAIASIALIMLVSAAGAARAACPGEGHDGKIVSVTGRIDDDWRETTYVYDDKSKSTNAFTVRECEYLIILTKQPPAACKKGATITAKGKFWYCDGDDYDDGFCDADELYSTSVSCR
jgi:hypothetical protein